MTRTHSENADSILTKSRLLLAILGSEASLAKRAVLAVVLILLLFVGLNGSRNCLGDLGGK